MSHMLMSSMGSSWPKSPTNMIDEFPKVYSLGSIPASLNWRRFACCSLKCILAKTARPRKEISSTIKSSTLLQVCSKRRKAAPSNSLFQAALGNTWKAEQIV